MTFPNDLTSDQMEFDIDYGPRQPNPNIAEDVNRFLTVFDIPKVSYSAAYEMVNEMFRPLPEEVGEVEGAVKCWCGI